jgi:hypothetical protein
VYLQSLCAVILQRERCLCALRINAYTMTDAPPAPTTSAPEPTTPTDLEVVKMVCYARAAHGPGLGAARALAEMKKRVPGLVLSERRLKALMHASGLAAQDPPKDTPWDTRTPGMFEDACREKARPLRAFAPPKAPRAVLDGSPGFEPDTRFAGRPLPDALQRQLDFIANSGASYLIYGPDALDWAVTLTWDRDYQLKVCSAAASRCASDGRRSDRSCRGWRSRPATRRRSFKCSCFCTALVGSAGSPPRSSAHSCAPSALSPRVHAPRTNISPDTASTR